VTGVDERGRHGHRTVVGAALVAVVVGCAAGVLAGGIGLFTLFGEARLGDVAGFAALVALLAMGTVGAVLWVLSARPGAGPSMVVVVPFAVAWALFVPWYRLRFPFWYIGWTAAGLVALAVLTVWYGRGRWRDPRRAVAYLCAVAAVVVVNGTGVAAVVWTSTNGFGLRGQPAPWTAFDALARTSCLADHDTYRRGSRLVRSVCPSGPDADYYAGTYDRSGFDELLCAEQPRSAFAKWWDWNRQLHIEFVLAFDYDQVTIDGRQVGPPFPASAGGRSATMTVTAELVEVARSDLPESQRARFPQAHRDVDGQPRDGGGAGRLEGSQIDVSEHVTVSTD